MGPPGRAPQSSKPMSTGAPLTDPLAPQPGRAAPPLAMPQDAVHLHDRPSGWLTSTDTGSDSPRRRTPANTRLVGRRRDRLERGSMSL